MKDTNSESEAPNPKRINKKKSASNPTVLSWRTSCWRGDGPSKGLKRAFLAPIQARIPPLFILCLFHAYSYSLPQTASFLRAEMVCLLLYPQQKKYQADRSFLVKTYWWSKWCNDEMVKLLLFSKWGKRWKDMHKSFMSQFSQKVFLLMDLCLFISLERTLPTSAWPLHSPHFL